MEQDKHWAAGKNKGCHFEQEAEGEINHSACARWYR